MKKLRLLLWEDCNRNCEGCCNKDWDLASLPSIHLTKKELSSYDMIVLTGGEPLLYPELTAKVAMRITNLCDYKTPIILYTAWNKWDIHSDVNKANINVLWKFTGITYTLHSREDLIGFYNFIYTVPLGFFRRRTIRLNCFDNAAPDYKTIEWLIKVGWEIKYIKEWIKNCPLPQDEEFKRLAKEELVKN